MYEYTNTTTMTVFVLCILLGLIIMFHIIIYIFTIYKFSKVLQLSWQGKIITRILSWQEMAKYNVD